MTVKSYKIGYFVIYVSFHCWNVLERRFMMKNQANLINFINWILRSTFALKDLLILKVDKHEEVSNPFILIIFKWFWPGSTVLGSGYIAPGMINWIERGYVSSKRTYHRSINYCMVLILETSFSRIFVCIFPNLLQSSEIGF